MVGALAELIQFISIEDAIFVKGSEKMSIRSVEYLQSVVRELAKLPSETE